MKRTKLILILCIVINAMIGSLCYGQPKLPKQSIPLEAHDYVKKQIERLYSSSPVDRCEAAVELGRWGKRAIPAIPYLIEMLGDSAPLDWVTREGQLFPTSPGGEAAVSLGEIGDSRAVEPLIAALKNKGYTIRWKIVDALGKIRDRRAVELLIALLKDTNESDIVRFRVPDALGEIGDTRAVEPLIESLNDEDTIVREHAVKALEKISGKAYGSEPAEWQKWWKENKEKGRKAR